MDSSRSGEVVLQPCPPGCPHALSHPPYEEAELAETPIQSGDRSVFHHVCTVVQLVVCGLGQIQDSESISSCLSVAHQSLWTSASSDSVEPDYCSIEQLFSLPPTETKTRTKAKTEPKEVRRFLLRNIVPVWFEDRRQH